MQNANRGSTSSTMAVRRKIPMACDGNGNDNPPRMIATSSQAGQKGRHDGHDGYPNVNVHSQSQ